MSIDLARCMPLCTFGTACLLCASRSYLLWALLHICLKSYKAYWLFGEISYYVDSTLYAVAYMDPSFASIPISYLILHNSSIKEMSTY